MTETQSAVIPSAYTIQIQLDNLTGQVSCGLSHPLPFHVVAHVLARVVSQLGDLEIEKLTRAPQIRAVRT